MTDVKCFDHLNYVNGECPVCGYEVDAYGNTEASFENCAFPNCGCDGARLCMAGEANNDAIQGNVEGMWSNGSKKECRKAAFYTMSLCGKKESEGA